MAQDKQKTLNQQLDLLTQCREAIEKIQQNYTQHDFEWKRLDAIDADINKLAGQMRHLNS